MSRSKPIHFFLDKDTDGALHLRWNSPATENHVPNSLDMDSLKQLETILDQILRAPCPALVILSSGNNRGFGSGFTKNFLANNPSDELLIASETLQRCCQKIGQIPSPIIAAVSGPCLDEALEIALCCDYRVFFDSPRTWTGFRSTERHWYPSFTAIIKTCDLLGMERGFKLITSSILLQAKTALQWGLADSAPKSEQELRKEIGFLKGKALSRGKVSSPLPKNWVRRFLHTNSVGRKWVAKGLTRWLDRILPHESPWNGYLGSALSDCAAGGNPSLSKTPQLFKLAVKNPLTEKSLLFNHAFDRWSDSQTRQPPETIQRLFCDSSEISNHPILRILQSKAVPIESNYHDSQLSGCRMEGLATWKQIPTQQNKTPRADQDLAKISLSWFQGPNCLEQAFLWGPFQQSTRFYAALESPRETCPKLMAMLAGLGIRATAHSDPQDSWISLIFTLIENTLMVLAQNLDAGLFEQEARRKGWLCGPCWWMQSNDIVFLSKAIHTWNANSNDVKNQAPAMEFSRRFADWVQLLAASGGFDSRNPSKGLWVHSDKSGIFHASSTGRKWPTIANLGSDLTFQALPAKQRHVEAVNRVEKALVAGWQKISPKNQELASFVFFHALLGFPSWKIVSLMPILEDFWGGNNSNLIRMV